MLTSHKLALNTFVDYSFYLIMIFWIRNCKVILIDVFQHSCYAAFNRDVSYKSSILESCIEIELLKM